MNDPNEPEGIYTSRFKHVVTEDGHAIITGRGGNTLQRCEDEPIHAPGAIQGFGMLIALSEVAEGRLEVRIVSENCGSLIGYTPKQLFALDGFCDILTEEQTEILLEHVELVKEIDVDPAADGPEVFTIAIQRPHGRSVRMWCAMHINDKNRNLIICEFELEHDTINPLVPADDDTPDVPEDTLSCTPTAEELSESTINLSRPLRVIRGARKRGGEAAMEVFNIMSQIQDQLANATTIDIFLKILVGVVRELTGFHRVMIYQFDSNWNGRVVTELVDPRATKDLYKGLNFPASDIPRQAREMYKINKVRLLYDRDQETARLVCRTMQDLEDPLDLTFAYLRAMSPIHIKYLGNMAVRSSMSISINAFSELWGLIACHAYGSKGMRVSFPIRKMCRLIGDTASRNIERLSYATRLQARKLINTAPTSSNPTGYIIASSEDLLKLFDADCGLLSIHEETKTLGKIEQTQEVLAMLEYLRLRTLTSVTYTADISFDFPDLRYPPGFSVIAGLLLVPLSVSGSDFIVFFRRGQTREVKWAGNPYEKFLREGTEGYLEPRKSFKTWSETVVGKCRDWTEEQIETSAVLCLVYGKFIEVWRQKEVAIRNSQLTKLLLANSAHEVRTPLNAIINYLEIALEGTIDQDTRKNLSRSHSASKSLICVINDLLDLTKAEEGLHLVKNEIFDLPKTVREAANSFSGEANRKSLEFRIRENESIPQLVVGDQQRVRQAIFNIIANAIKFTDKGSVQVETWMSARTDNSVEVEIVVQDTGCGMPSAMLDLLFRDLEQVEPDQESAAVKALEPKVGSKQVLGLGLALVARIVRNMQGQLRVKSESGKGSRFVMQLGFSMPDERAIAARLEEPSTPPAQSGEVTLINRSPNHAQNLRPESGNHRSTDSLRSLASHSSGQSNVDRLIETIQDPIGRTPGLSAEVSKMESQLEESGTKQIGPHKNGQMQINTAVGSVVQADRRPVDGPGTYPVQGSKTPIRPIRVREQPTSEQNTQGVSPNQKKSINDRNNDRRCLAGAQELEVLVAEDDPINSKIVKKRLERSGHKVRMTVNGEECSSTFGDEPAAFDVVLMDIQVCS